MAKHKGVDPSGLYGLPEVSPECLYIFKLYCEVKGQEPLTFRELEAWANLTGVNLTPGEVETLFSLDAVFYQSQQKE